MSFRKSASLAALSLVGALLVGLFGCSTGSSTTSGNTSMRTVNALVGSTTSVVNFTETSPTATPFTSNVNYGTAAPQNQTPPYVTVGAGLGVNFYVLVGQNLATSAAYNITANTDYTLIAFGDPQASTSSGQTPTLIPFQDNLPSTATLGATNTAIRIIHVAPAFTLSANAANQYVSLYSNGSPITGMTNIQYGNASSYVQIPAGSYSLTLHNQSGATIALPTQTATNLSSISLGAGHAYTLLFVGTDDNGGAAPTPASTCPPDIKVLVDE